MSKNTNRVFLDVLSEWFGIYLPKVKGISPKTLQSYKDCFRLLFQFLNEKKQIPPDKVSFEVLDYDLVIGFLQWLEDERGNSVSTRNQRLSALSSFSDYAQKRNLEAAVSFRTAMLRIPKKRDRQRARAYFSKEEVRLLLSIPDTSTLIGKRDSVLLSLMYATGARAQEICNLKVRDIQFLEEEKARISLMGKGGKRRNILIGKTPAKILCNYFKGRSRILKSESYVFSSQTHDMMSVACIEEIFSKYIALAREANPSLFRENSYSPHSMRHTTACHMLESGVSIIAIKNFLGHSSINTTEIYAQMTQNSIDKAITEWNEKWFGENKVKDDPQRYKTNLPDFLIRN